MILLVHFSLVVLLLDSRLARDVEKPFIAGLAGGGPGLCRGGVQITTSIQ